LVRNAADGQPLVKLDGFRPDKYLSLVDAAFTPDGAKIIGVVHGDAGHMVVRWNFASGKIEDEFAIPSVSLGESALLGTRGLMLFRQADLPRFGSFLVDLQQKQLAATLGPENGVHAAAPDGSYWRTDYALRENQGAYYVQGFGADAFAWPNLPSPPPYALNGGNQPVGQPAFHPDWEQRLPVAKLPPLTPK
jgi:hypothetical protein